MKIKSAILCVLLFSIISCSPLFAVEPKVVNVWPEKPPGPARNIPAEGDPAKPDVVFKPGEKVTKLTNVAIPQIYIYTPNVNKTDTAVIVCPGGGHSNLAINHEGYDVADWLNSHGVTAIILKYRVPFQNPDKKWEMAVQDAQRATSLVRSMAKELNIHAEKVGMIGFSAGGETAVMTSLLEKREYKEMDDVDKLSCRPDFSIVVYPGGLVNPENNKLREFVKVTPKTPPMFLVHAWDDRVTILNSVLLAEQLKLQQIPFELHIYPTGGHGYGLRASKEPVSKWSGLAETWMRQNKMLPSHIEEIK